MKPDCGNLEQAMREPGGETARAFQAHLGECPRCREEMDLWLAISEAAPSLRKEWPSRELWSRIERAAADERLAFAVGGRPRRPHKIGAAWPRWGALAAGALVAAVSAAVLWLSLGSAPEDRGGPPRRDPLLTERALLEVERTEAAYVRSIERLSALVQPTIADAGTPLLINYREKLRVIDEAILEIRANLETNRFNAHARAELLAAYRQKSDVLTELMKERQP